MAKIRLLIVDDHPMIRKGLVTLLSTESDMDVVGEAADGEEAVRLSGELKPDVVIMDIVMPKLNGIEATKLITENVPATRVLILSAYDDIAYILETLEKGAAGYVLKDARGNELIGAIRAVHSGESVFDPIVTRKLLERVEEQSRSTVNQSAVPLTAREVEILGLASKGLANKDIANQLSLSVRTVKAHLTNIFSKMGCGSRTDAIIKGLKAGYITLEEENKE